MQTYIMLHNILSKEDYTAFNKLFGIFKEDLEMSYWICGASNGDCGEYCLWLDEMLENLIQIRQDEPTVEVVRFIGLVEKVIKYINEAKIDRVFLSF